MTPQSFDDERLRRAFRIPRESAPPSGRCPPDEAIWQLASAELDPGRVADLLEHVAGCPACAESLNVARALREEAAAASEASERRPPRRRALPLPLALGLATAAAVALFLLVPRGDRPGGPDGARFRDAGARSIGSLLDEDTPLSRESCVLRWTAGPPGTIYTVEVALEDLTVIDRAEELEIPEHRVPPAALERLRAGTALLWRVDALWPDATPVESPVFRVTLE